MVRPYHVGKKVVAFGCNDSYRVVDFLNVLYACDPPWWDIHVKPPYDVLSHPSVKWTQCKSSAPKYKLEVIGGHTGPGLSSQQDLIHFGGNSGFQLLNLALLYGVQRFILCGYNMQPVGGQKHFFGDHPQGLNRSAGYASFASSYQTIQPEWKSRIINATPDSVLSCFKKMELADALDAYTKDLREPDGRHRRHWTIPEPPTADAS